MNIGFDLDKVFIDTPPFIPKTVIEKLYKKKRQWNFNVQDSG